MFEDPKNPCPNHPGYELHECWRCGYATRPTGPYFRGLTLSKREQDSFETLTGVVPTDRDHMNRIMAERDLRFIDKGDKQDVLRKELHEWRSSAKDPKRRGKLPNKALREKFDPPKRVLDIRKVLEETTRA